MSSIAKNRIHPELKRRAIPFPVQADGSDDEVLSPAGRRNQLADEFGSVPAKFIAAKERKDHKE
jgi:acetyl-CoA carboxylase carboxyltransferase component